MFFSSVLDSAAIDEKQVQSFFSKLTLEKQTEDRKSVV